MKDSWHERYPNLHAASLTRSLAYRCGSPIRTFPYAISLSRFRRCLAGGHGDEPDQREVSERQARICLRTFGWNVDLRSAFVWRVISCKLQLTQENGAPSPSHSHMPLERLRRLPGAILRTLDDFLMPRERVKSSDGCTIAFTLVGTFPLDAMSVD